MSPIIDIYCHIFPDRYFQEMTRVAPNLENIGKRLRGVTKLFDLDARFREMDEFGDYRQIISLPNPAIEDIAAPGVGLNLARVANDAMGELCRKYPQRFPAFAAALCMTDVEGSVAEARRAIKDLGARGVLLYTNVAGRPLDDPQFEPIFATMAELDLPIWLHPVGTAAMPDYPAEKKSRFEMWWCFHWPYETSVAMVRMVFSGLLDRYPKLKIITHHLGGMIPYYDGRVGPGLKVLGQRTSDEDYSKILPSLKRPHMDYLHDFYADTAMFGGGVPATRCGYEFFGAEHVVFATDAPLGPISADHQNSGRAKPAGGRATRDLLRQRGATAEYEIQLTNPGYFFFFLSTSAALVTPVKLGGSLAGKLSSELVATSSSWRLARSRSASILSRTGLSRWLFRECLDSLIESVISSLLCLPKRISVATRTPKAWRRS